MKLKRKHLWLTALAVTVGIATACGKPVPVQELADARAEIAAAAAVKADEHSAAEYGSAREALIAAHKHLADEQPDDARKKALEASQSAFLARYNSAPKYVAAQKQAGQTAINDADEAYAEVLAKDDFEAAKKLQADGDALAGEADSMAAGAGDDAAKKRAGLEKYEEAGQKYAAAEEAAGRAKNKSLAQKDDLLDSLSGVETLLRRAEQYRAAELAPEQYNAAKSEIDSARNDISAGKLKSGNGHILKAEELSRATLNAVLERYAKDRKAEATKVVAAADDSFKRSGAATVDDDAIKAKAAKVQEMLSAAHESVASAEKNFSGSKYEDSIKDSDEAIRLAGIVNEQMAALQQEVAVVIKKRGGTTTNGGNTTNPSQWRTYVVQKKKPVDCLWRIAGSKSHYGNPWLWKKIYQANKDKINDPDLIFPGQVLWIPPKNYKGGKPPASTGEVRPDKKAEEKKPEPETKPRENIE